MCHLTQSVTKIIFFIKRDGVCVYKYKVLRCSLGLFERVEDLQTEHQVQVKMTLSNRKQGN